MSFLTSFCITLLIIMMKSHPFMQKARFTIIGVILILSYSEIVSAQTDTIRLRDKRLNTSVLKPGLNQYLVYFQNPKKSKNLDFSLWLRNVQMETRNGQKAFCITQRWYASDSAHYVTFSSLNNEADFAPIYHSETVSNKIKAYDWSKERIIGADSVAQNLQKGFSLDFKTPNFNWNLDIETFEMLPLAEGKTFAINFYDAGLDPPAYVLYKVTGSEVLATLDNQKIDCWKLYTEGHTSRGTHYSETYWISKKNHIFLKEEDSFNGLYRYKIKMSGAAPDLVDRFVE
jgi:hypothetical protein